MFMLNPQIVENIGAPNQSVRAWPRNRINRSEGRRGLKGYDPQGHSQYRNGGAGGAQGQTLPDKVRWAQSLETP